MESQQQQQEENNNNNTNKKKTRDLPNLSECHSCGYRIDSCNNDKNNNNNRLQTLYSEWRIVLLCKICFFRVESSILCAYCFKGSSSSDDDDSCFFNCRQCKHIIHKSCFSKYSNVAPWSFSWSFSSKFSVCVDCWVPKSIASKRACSRSKKRNSNSKCNLLEDVVRDANFDVQRKVEAAARARELAVEKALAARMAAQLAHNALELVSETDVNHIANVDDVQLALCLHRALNSSPRILNNLSSLSSAGSSPLVRTDVCTKLNVSRGVKSAADPSVSAYDSSLIVDSLGSKGIYDSWVRLNAIESEIQLKEGEDSCSDKLMNSKSQSCRLQDGFAVLANEKCNGKPDRYSRKYTRRTSADERCNGKPDRYSIKYTRRTSADKRYNRKPDLYLRKYVRRTSAYARYDGKVGGYLRKYTRRRTTVDERYNGKLDRNAIKYTYTRRRKNQRSTLALCSNCLYDRLNHATQTLQLD